MGVEEVLQSAAKRYLGIYFPDRSLIEPAPVRVDWAYLTALAKAYDALCHTLADPVTTTEFLLFRAESLLQFEYLLSAGVRVLPWLHSCAPYNGINDLSRRVNESRVLYVYLSRTGYGPRGIEQELSGHPMLEPSGYKANGVDFCVNDVFRAVHDAFGHLAFRCNLLLAGEIRAVSVHRQMYSSAVRRVLFGETIAQIASIYAAAARHGRPLAVDNDDRFEPCADIFPAQKVGLLPMPVVDQVDRLFARWGETG